MGGGLGVNKSSFIGTLKQKIKNNLCLIYFYFLDIKFNQKFKDNTHHQKNTNSQRDIVQNGMARNKYF